MRTTAMRTTCFLSLWIVCAALSGCNLLTPLIFLGEHKKTISAEFDKFANARVAVVVWTDPSTLFDYPYARFEMATYIGDKLHAEMTQRNLGTDVVDPRDVEDYLEKNVDAQIDPYSVGKAFDADYVLYLEILEFQMRDPDQPQLLRGRVHATVTVHDIRVDPDVSPTFELDAVRCEYPKRGPVLMNATNSPIIRESTYHMLSEMVARKFYDYKVDL